MCRIVGFVDNRNCDHYDHVNIITQMRDTMIHGGPDDAGIFIDDEHGIAFGHRRLSILDLSQAGHQPMSCKDGNVWITYNGEIYNFKEIKNELEKKGYHFHSQTDTEVIINAYLEWGVECVKRFHGMWAFALYDRQSNEIILCRDRVGVKPLYWHYSDSLFMFASELKAFCKHPHFKKNINKNSLAYYFQYGYIPAPHCIYDKTYKLQQGSYLILNLNTKNIAHNQYWRYKDYIVRNPCDIREGECIEELERRLHESFQLRMIADVPIGVFLSGGIDSSLVTAMIQNTCTNKPIHTFSIGFHEKSYNEATYAKKIAHYLGTNHYELYCTTKDFSGIITKLSSIYDEPFGDSSSIPTYLVSRFAREQVKVILSGDGGDELFLGYTRYWLAKRRALLITIASSLDKISRQSLDNKFIKFALHFTLNSIYKIPDVAQKYEKFLRVIRTRLDEYDAMIRVFTDVDLHRIGLDEQTTLERLLPSNSYSSEFDKMMCIDFKYYLPDDILTKVDRATMAVGLEGREPLLDQSIIEYAASIPAQLKFKDKTSKYLLKKILKRYLPEKLFIRPKMGFGIPLHEWMIRDNKILYKEVLSSTEIKRFDILDSNGVDDIVNHTGTASQIWLLLQFQLWCDEYLT